MDISFALTHWTIAIYKLNRFIHFIKGKGLGILFQEYQI